MKVSVVVPIYNREKYLRDCLNSLVEQDYEDYEVILIDDGSTDCSAKICQEYVRKYHYFQYIYQENMGPGQARNTGLRKARGTYIFFLDSDDIIQKNSLKKLLLFAEQNKADMIYFDEVVCSESMEVLSVRRTYSEMDIKILKQKALELCMDPAHICARMYHRKLFDNLCFKNIWYEDMEIFPKLLLKASRLYYYKVPIYYYRQHKEAITHQESDKRNLDVISAWNNILLNTTYTEDERTAIEIAIKKSVFTFVFFHPQFADAYVRFYNCIFKKNIKGNFPITQIADIDVKYMPLWQQADFYEKFYCHNILTEIQELYRYGGVLRFLREEEAYFHESTVDEELIVLLIEKNRILLKEIKLQRGNRAIFGVLNRLSKWNLISLKNKAKDFPVVQMLIEEAILDNIKLEIERIN